MVRVVIYPVNLATEDTLDDIRTDLATIKSDVATMATEDTLDDIRTDLATIKSDVATMKTDLAAILAILES